MTFDHASIEVLNQSKNPTFCNFQQYGYRKSEQDLLVPCEQKPKSVFDWIIDRKLILSVNPEM